ncbi:hypothetical protein [Neorhodopirellula pilleata]|uniref:Uncharacterized protein n=1 Tax=Neorhodopirellula pilleata TaxID=2714738 RepID=A0A5C6AXZ1_9BACT|nr:hypothetical protein [Neorhodopirellula pilleata]TWU03942.1 hypothetical protein Pla100_08780 [Neorhodopirellula pilleata]
MGGAVMLLIAATVGVTYGWTPDGGRGVKYIIQIPPDQVEQVVRSGEIASRIPTEIQGHVSEVVVRVGNGTLPRVTPSNLARADFQAVEPNQISGPNQAGASRHSDGGPISSLASDDCAPLPIPAMNSPMELSPIRNPDAATAMMKPAPQGGGMNLPGSLGVSQSNTPRPSTNPLSNPLTGPSTTSLAAPPTMNSAASGLAGNGSTSNLATGNGMNFNLQQTARDVLGNATDAARSTINNAVDRATGNDDPRSRLSQPVTSTRNPAATSQSEQDWYDLRNGSRRRPSTDPVETNVASNGQDASRSPSLLENSNFGRLPSGLDNYNGADANASASNPRYSNDSQTIDPNRNVNTQNVSTRQPNTQTTPRSEYSDPSRSGADRSSSYDYDPKLTIAQAQQLPINGYSFDSQGYPIDRQGYRLNRFGQRLDDANRTTVATNENSSGYDSTNRYPSGSNLTDVNRNQPAYNTQTGNGTQYTQNAGNPALVQPPLAPAPGQTAATGAYPQGPFAPGTYPQGTYGQGNLANVNNPYGYPANSGSGLIPQYSDPQYSDPRYSDPRYTQLVGNPSTTVNPNLPSGLAPIGDPTTRSGSPTRTTADDEPRSSSDATGISTVDRYREALQNPEQVAAQPIFNAMLLLSVVTNAYLLFWLKNLRMQFRDTVAAKRSSNSAGSLAASV